jgi:hypothetical protein
MAPCLLCLLLSLRQCPAAGFAGFEPTCSPLCQSKALEKSFIPKDKSLVPLHEGYRNVSVSQGFSPKRESKEWLGVDLSHNHKTPFKWKC